MSFTKLGRRWKLSWTVFSILTFDMHTKFEDRKLFFIPIDNLISIPISLFFYSMIKTGREKLNFEKKMK